MSEKRKLNNFFDKFIKEGIEAAFTKKKKQFDETFFTFQLCGGSIHSQLISAEAFINDGEDAGQQIPIQCIWYKTTQQNELKEIEGVNGSFYQPSIDDINSRICIKAMPQMEDYEYIGMPIFKEIGPLKMDQKIFEEVNEYKNAGKATLLCKIESIYNITNKNLDYLSIDYPVDCLIKLTKDSIKCEILKDRDVFKVIAQDFNNVIPVVNILKKTSNNFDINIGPNNLTLRMKSANNIDRDIITLAIRTFCKDGSNQQKQQASNVQINNENAEENQQKDVSINQNKINSQNNLLEKTLNQPTKQSSQNQLDQDKNNIRTISEDQQQQSYQQSNNELIQKQNQQLQEQSEEQKNNLGKINTEKQELINQIDQLKQQDEENQERIKELRQFVEECNKNYAQLCEEMKLYKEKSQNLINEKCFFTQEIHLLKCEIKEKQLLILEKENKIKELQQNQNLETNTRILNKQIIELKQVIDKLNIELSKSNEEVNNLIAQNKNLKREMEWNINNNEQLEIEITNLKKKCNSLIKEKGLINSIKSEEKLSDGDISIKDNYSTSPQSMCQWDNNSRIQQKSGQKKKNQDLNKKIKSSTLVEEIKNYDGQDKEIERLREQVLIMDQHLINLRKEYNLNLQQLAEFEKQTQQKKFSSFLSNINQLIEGKTGQQSDNNSNFLQKLANSLSETIQEQNIALDNQRQINKELVKKIFEQENQIAQLLQREKNDNLPNKMVNEQNNKNEEKI